MSIIRVGLAETKKFAEGYDAIFGKKEEEAPKQPETEQQSNATRTETEQQQQQGGVLRC